MNPPDTSQPTNSNFFLALLVSGFVLLLLFSVALGVYEVVKGGPSDGFGFELVLYWKAWLAGWVALAAVYSTFPRAREIIRISIVVTFALMMMMGLVRYLGS